MEPSPNTIRFGTFEANPAAGELRKAGRLVRLQDQPFRLLLILLEHPGEVVTRDQIRERLWGSTSIEFEEGMNTAVRKLREALEDSATNPRFIETLPRRGYRFVAAVSSPPPDPPEQPTTTPARPRLRRWPTSVAAGLFVLIAAFLVIEFWPEARKRQLVASSPVQLTRDTGLTTSPAISRDGKLIAYASDKAGKENLDIWVQNIPGGEAHQLTDDPADDDQPDISPDGTEVAFRSERDGGGIYSVPTLGGTARLIARKGYLPRFSPDGSRLAWATGAFGVGAFSGKLHVQNSANGVTHDLAPEVFIAGAPAWSPDGRYLAVVGSLESLNGLYLWTCPADGGRATRMSASAITDESRLAPGVERTISVAWFENQLIVAAKKEDSSNLWAGTVSLKTGQLIGQLKRLTLGSGTEALPSVSLNGKLAFANHTRTMDIWEAPLSKNAPMTRLTHSGGLNYGPSVLADGSRFTFISDQTGKPEAWLKDLGNGKDRMLTRNGYREASASISRDGTRFALWDGAGVSVGSIAGGPLRQVCKRCGRPDGWFPDGGILVWNVDAGTIDKVDAETGSSLRIVGDSSSPAVAPRLSPDGKWIVFHTVDYVRNVRQILIAPYTGLLVPRSEWIEVTDGTALDREAQWSPGGDLIYFLSERDGYRCIWARKLDRKTNRPLGPIYPVLHLHNPRVSPLQVSNTGSIKLNPVGYKLIFTMGELTGNLWLTELQWNQ